MCVAAGCGVARDAARRKQRVSYMSQKKSALVGYPDRGANVPAQHRAYRLHWCCCVAAQIGGCVSGEALMFASVMEKNNGPESDMVEGRTERTINKVDELVLTP
jgi:hypothetical protein